MDDLIRRSDAIKSVLGITMLQGRVPIDTVIYQINSIPAVEPCKDAVSREWLLNELEEMNVANFYELNEHSNEMYGQMKRMIKAAPSVTVEPKPVSENIIEACVLATATREAYEEGMADTWKIAQTVFGSTVTLYEAMDVARCMKGVEDETY